MLRVCVVVAFLAALMIGLRPTTAQAALPSGFQESVVFSGLTNPTAIRFASDGRIFVAEKSGLIKVFDNLSDTTPTIFADLRTNVYNFWDRGLLGLALDPNFPTKPYVYVLYTYDHILGSSQPAPRWGTAGATSDPCPTPPGATTDGCVVSGRLSRLQASGNTMTGSEQVLIEDWCQQFPSHSIGSLVFGADGKLYASAGEGASFNNVDYGQYGSPLNPCGDPPSGVGGTEAPPTAEGGALRSQDLSTSGDPTGLDGTIIRIDPDTGAGLADNPLGSSSDANARRIVAYGLRNPFRITTRPGTNEIWIGDVGWSDWEEINRLVNPTASSPANFGWPCYEGPGRQPAYDSTNLNICENLYATPNAVTPPFFAYNHSANIVPGESCTTGSSSISGQAFQFYSGGPYPAQYDGSLFFADYSRDCIWVMFKGTNGLPDPSTVRTFVAPAANPVDIQLSPAGELYYADFDGGTIRRITYASAPGPLPSPWVDQDIGSVGVAGSASANSGTFTVQGSGTDIWGTADGFNFVYQPLSGDGTITARVTSLANTNEWAKAGVMIRESLSPGSRHAFTAVTASNGLSFQRRLVTNDISTDTPGVSAAAPYWVRLVRSGSTLSSYQSSDGSTWSLIGSDTVSMATNVYVGLAVTSHNNTVLTTATFDNVTVSTSAPPANQPPTATISSPSATTTWKVGDVINFSGSATDPEDGTLPASALSWTLILHHCPSNCHTHLIQTWTGVASGSFTAPDHEYPSYLELQLTATDSGGAQNTTSVQLDPQTVTLSFQSNPTGLQLAVNSTNSATPFTRQVIVGSNNSISATSPQTLNSTTYTFNSWSDGGAQSHNITAGATASTYTATYSGSTPSPLPSPWVDQDIGSVGVAGSASASSGTFTVQGSGTDIWGTADGFNFVYQPLSGDGTITARVASLANTNEWAKAGVMIRESLSAGSRHAFTAVTVGNGTAFQRRLATDGTSLHTAGVLAAAPYWVRLVRSGSTLSSYQSSDGSTWSLIGSDTVSMATNVYVGLAVTSHDNSVLTTASFDNVTLSTSAPPPDTTPPTVTASTPSSGATNIAVATNVTATFSEAVTGVSSTTFTLTPQGGTAPVAATVSYNSSTRTATLDPTSDLSANTTYTAQLTSGITDSANNPLASVSWSFTTAASAPPPTNLLLNGGFELDANNDGRPDSWTTNNHVTRSNAVVHGGSYSMRHSATDNKGYTIAQTVSNLAAGANYSFSGWVNIPATTDSFTFVIQVAWRNASNSTISTSTVKTYTAATSGWNQAQASLVAPAGTTNAEVRMVVGSLKATIYVDDFVFQ